MTTVAAYSNIFSGISTKLTTLQSSYPANLTQLQAINTRLQALKTNNINHVSSLIPSLNGMVSNATAASGFLGNTLTSCPLFNEYIQKLEATISTTAISTIDSKITEVLNNPGVVPIADSIVEINNRILEAENIAQGIIQRTLDIQNKFNTLIQSYVNISNMLRNPCSAVTYLSNSQLVGELNPNLQSQANQALDIVESVGGKISDITSNIQQQIVNKASIISGILS